MHVLWVIAFVAVSQLHDTAASERSAPKDLTVYRWNKTSVGVRWKPPSRTGSLRHYKVKLEALGSSDWSRRDEVDEGARCDAWPDEVCWSEHDLPDSDSLYKVTVRARTDDDDEGRAAQTVIDTSNNEAPQAVEELRASRVKSRTLRLRWSLPSKLNKLTRSNYFRVEMKPTDSDKRTPRKVNIRIEEEKASYSFPIGKLEPDTKYTVSVQIVGDRPGQKATITVTTTGTSDSQEKKSSERSGNRDGSDEDDGISFLELLKRIGNSED